MNHIHFCQHSLAAASLGAETATPMQLFSTANAVISFSCANNNTTTSTVALLTDLAKLHQEHELTPQQRILVLALVIEAVRTVGSSYSDMDALMARLQPIFSSSIALATSEDQQSEQLGRFVACCLARMVNMNRAPLAPFLAVLAVGEDREAAAAAGEGEQHQQHLPYRFVLDVLSEIAHSTDTEQLQQHGGGDEILSVVLRQVTTCTSQHAVAELCRRVLIPLLNSQPRLRQSHKDVLVSAANQLATMPGRESEAILVIASLFDTLFDTNSRTPCGEGGDLRSSTALWDLVLRCLRRISFFGEDASVRANLHSQAVYLLKRIVACTAGRDLGAAEEDAQKRGKKKAAATTGKGAAAAAAMSTNTATATDRYAFDREGRFVWSQGESDRFLSQFEQFFVVFESLNEYASHLCQPALLSLKSLWHAGFVQPAFIEAALFKALVHGNVGVRRSALQLLWDVEPSKAARELSLEFLGKTLLVSAGDPRMCMEVDRALLLNSNVNNNDGATEEKSTSLLAAGRAVADPVTAPLMSTVARFSRYLCRVVEALLAEQNDNNGGDKAQELLTTMISAISSNKQSEEAPRFCIAVFCRSLRDVCHTLRNVSSFTEAHRDAVVAALTDVLPSSIHGRHTAWMESRFVALLLECAMLVAPPQATLERFLLVAGPLAESGGQTQAAIDACGTVLPMGSALPMQLLRAVMLEASVFSADSDGKNHPERIVNAFVHQQHHPVPLLDTVALKSLCLMMFDLAPAAKIVVDLLSTLDQGAERSPGVVVRAAAVFSELCSYGDDDVNRLAAAAGATIVRGIIVFVVRSLSIALSATACSDATSPSSSKAQSFPPEMQSDAFDALCAALFWAVRLGAQDGGIDFPALWGACHQVLAALNNSNTKSNNATTAQQQRRVMWERNSVRFVQAAAAGATVIRGEQNNSSFVVPYVFQEQPRELLSACLKVVALRPSFDAPCSELTAHNWSIIAAQHYKATWTSVLVFLIAATDNSKNNNATEQLNDLLFAVGHRAVDELDCCAATNLSCIFDILCVVLSSLSPSGSSSSQVSDFCLATARTMHKRISDGYRRERLRCAAIYCFAVARCRVLPPGSLSELLMPLLTGDEEASQRVPWLVAQAVAERSLANDGEACWLECRGILLHIAVFANVAISDTDEGEAVLAAMEPVLVSSSASAPSFPSPFAAIWKLLCRNVFPPTTRMMSLARASAIVALHQHAAAAANQERGQWVVDTLLDWSESHKEIFKQDAVMVNSSMYRNRLRLWQTVASLAPLLPATATVWHPLVKRLIDRSLAQMNSPVIRKLIEAVALQGISAATKETLPLLISAAKQLDARPFFTASMIQLCAVVATNWQSINNNNNNNNKQQLQQQREEEAAAAAAAAVFDELVAVLESHCASHQHVHRLVAGIAITELVAARQQEQAAAGGISEQHSVVSAFVAQHPEYRKQFARFRGSVGFDLASSFLCNDARSIFSVQRQDGNQWAQDTIPFVAFRRVAGHSERELRSLLGALVASPFDLLRGALLGCDSHRLEVGPAFCRQQQKQQPEGGEDDLYIDFSEVAEAAAAAAAAAAAEGGEKDANTASSGISSNLQRKTAPWWQCSVHNELVPRSIGVRGRQKLIIVASLLNPVNVAGLFRSSEIFAAERIVISDKKLLAHPHFVAAARSSEQWMPYEAVSVASLPAFLERMRREEGYLVAAIEQTAESVQLGEFQFPDQSTTGRGVVLVLGAEQQGLPAHLLAHMDVCLEIPQTGLVRSLNVASCGTIAIYEYSRQQTQYAGKRAVQ